MDSEGKAEGSRVGIPPGIIFELFDYTQNGSKYVSTSIAVACAIEDMNTLFIGPTNATTHQAVEDYTRVVAKDNDDKVQLRAKANSNIYRTNTNTLWDLIHQVEKAASEGNFHTVVLEGLPLLIAELDLTYCTRPCRIGPNSRTLWYISIVLLLLIQEIGRSRVSFVDLVSPCALWPQRVARCLFVRHL